MAEPNYILYVASYDDDASASEDYEAIRNLGDTAVVAAAVLDRDSDGEVTAKEHGAGPVGGGAILGGGLGLVVGLFAPPLLAATVVGGAIGAGVGKLMKRHDEKMIGLDAEDPNHSGLIAGSASVQLGPSRVLVSIYGVHAEPPECTHVRVVVSVTVAVMECYGAARVNAFV